MDVLATRGWGIAVSSAMIAVALAIAFSAPERRPLPSQIAQPRGAIAVTPPPIAAARVGSAAPELVVHFRGRGPLARAERAQSARRVTAELSRQGAFRGLCFARFARHGVVLRPCPGGVLTGWMQRLHAMRAVARVEAGE